MVTKDKSSPPACPVTALLDIIGGKWKPIILYCLQSKTKRFGQVSALIPRLSRKVLSQQLKELERDGLILRQAYAEIPPRVEYSLTELGQTLGPVLNQMEAWGQAYLSKLKASQAQK